jgi:nitroreductase
MDVMEAIITRRSIRSYQDRAVAEETVTELLSAAMHAPSAGNEQPWHFVVVSDRGLLAKVRDVHPHAAMAERAPLAILVCGDLSLEKYPGFWVQDCSAAVQNLLLAAHGRGLGAVWTGIYPLQERVEGFRSLFRLPAQVIPLALVVIGHPSHVPKGEDRFRADRIHHNTW